MESSKQSPPCHPRDLDESGNGSGLVEFCYSEICVVAGDVVSWNRR